MDIRLFSSAWKPASPLLAALALLLLPCLLLFPSLSTAQTASLEYAIPFSETSPQIDGDMAPGEWGSASTIALTNETFPTQNVPALLDTMVYLMEDGDYFYAAFVAQDPEPDKIRAFYRDRDSASQDDMVGVVLDTFNDERRAFKFFSTPLGVQMDTILDDVNGNEDASWNAIWDSMGSITETGFIVEMRIPLHQLRFPGGLEEQTWGIDLVRFYPRDDRHRWTMNYRDFDISCYLCQLTKARGFSGLQPKTNLQLIPTFTATKAEDRANPLTDDWNSNNGNTEAGLDLRWGISQDLYLNATFNPDFSQVEADQAQLNVNNTFALFFPERREFFLDGADYFNMSERIVNTRNIADPDYGFKLTGKKDANTYGVFATNDTRTNFLIPGTQSSRIASLGEDVESQNLVMRYRRDIGSNNSTLGVIATNRTADDYSNTLLGVDGNIRLGNSDRVNFLLMSTESEYPQKIQEEHDQKQSLDDQAYTIRYSHDTNTWRWQAQYKSFGEEFRPDMGFIGRVGVKNYSIGGGRAWQFPAEDFFNRIRLNVFTGGLEDFNGLKLNEWTEFNFNMNGPLQSNVGIGFGPQDTNFNGQVFDADFLYLFANFRPKAGVNVSLNVQKNDAVDFANTRQGKSLTIRPNIGMRLGKHFQFNINYNYQQFDVPGGQLFSSNLSDVRLTYQFDVRSFVRAIVQYSDTKRNPGLYTNTVKSRSKNLTTQLLYSYKLNAQTRFFVGYSDTGLENDDFDRFEKTNRTIFAKFSYAWQY